MTMQSSAPCTYDDEPSSINEYGTKIWNRNGLIHRDNAPAVIYSRGTQMWYNDGLCHRDKAPAIIHPNGTYRWYYDGIEYTFEGYTIVCGLSDEEVVELRLMYGV